MSEKFCCYVYAKFCAYCRLWVCLRLTLDLNSALDLTDSRQDLFRKYWDHSLVFQDSIKFLEELNYVLMFEMPSPHLQIYSWIKCLEAFVFLSFLRTLKILLPFLFEVFWIDNTMHIFDYVKMNFVLKMNFLLSIDPYPIPVINIKNIHL